MKFENLYILHLPKGGWAEGLTASPGVFTLETCLRHIAVGRVFPRHFMPGTQIFLGEHAYRFLLEVACGLHSNMQGESEIFGQIKQGWRRFCELRAEEAKPLTRLMQNLFADTKQIRTEHLHGFGGTSYAGAVEKLLGMKKTGRILIIGAGQFGQMFAAKFSAKYACVTVANRSSLALEQLQKKHADIHILPRFEGLEEAIQDADHVLLSLPYGADPALEARILKCWKAKQDGTLLHLGRLTFTDTEWEGTPRFKSLKDVMNTQGIHSDAKREAIDNAFAAAREIAAGRAEPAQQSEAGRAQQAA